MLIYSTTKMVQKLKLKRVNLWLSEGVWTDVYNTQSLLHSKMLVGTIWAILWTISNKINDYNLKWNKITEWSVIGVIKILSHILCYCFLKTCCHKNLLSISMSTKGLSTLAVVRIRLIFHLHELLQRSTCMCKLAFPSVWIYACRSRSRIDIPSPHTLKWSGVEETDEDKHYDVSHQEKREEVFSYPSLTMWHSWRCPG